MLHGVAAYSYIGVQNSCSFEPFISKPMSYTSIIIFLDKVGENLT